MTNDTGFAPNPCHGFLTLANCMKRIRKSTPHKIINEKKEVWLAGFCGNDLSRKVCKKRNDNVWKLIYLARVTNHITYKEYWNLPEYQCKKPLTMEELKKKYTNKHFDENKIKKSLNDNNIDITDIQYQDICGDNIWSGNNTKSTTNILHIKGCGSKGEKNVEISNNKKSLDIWNHTGREEDDMKGENVLICKEFYYFGADNALDVPQEIKDALHPNKRHKDINDQTLIKTLIDHVKNNKGKLKNLTNNGIAYEG